MPHSIPRVVSVILVVLACAGTAFAQAPAPPANQWVAADIDWKKTLADFREDANWVTTDGYSDNSFRTKTGEVLIRTGIRSSSAGWNPGFYTNTSVLWDPKTDTAKVIDVFRWGGGSGGGGKLLEGFAENPTPSPRHTYDGMAYVPDEDALYLHMGATWRTGGQGVAPDAKQQHTRDERESTWKFTFADGKWTRIDHNIRKFWPSGVSPYEQHLELWPEKNKLLWLNDNGDRYAEFNLETQQWENEARIERPTVPNRLYNARSAWDSKRQLWVFRLGPDLCTFDPKTKSYTSLPRCWDLPPRPDEARQSDRRYAMKGVVYIPKHDAYLVTGRTGNDTMVYDVEAGKWSELKAGDIELVNGYLQYDPATDLVLMNYQLQCFKLRYEPAAQ
ncbi:MAG: hypothetical protein WD066_15120 [Planctomycetaceae bacterium]